MLDNLTDQERIDKIIVNNITLGRKLCEPKAQNELYWRMVALDAKDFKDVLYENLKFMDELNGLLKIEYITKTAYDLYKEKLKGRKELTPEEVLKLTPEQRIVYNVLVEFPGIDQYKDNAKLVFNCWKQQSPFIKRFMQLHPGIMIRLFDEQSDISEPISSTRLRRFVEEKYGKAQTKLFDSAA